MRRVAYITLSGNKTAKINTLYIAQKTFDLSTIGPKEVIDLINLKVVKEEKMDQYPFVARVWEGDGSQENPFSLAIEGRKNSKSNVFMARVDRCETKKIEITII